MKFGAICEQTQATVRSIDESYFNDRLIVEEIDLIIGANTKDDQCTVDLRRILQQMYVAYLFIFRFIDSNIPPKSITHAPHLDRIFKIANTVIKLKGEFSTKEINKTVQDTIAFQNTSEYFYIQFLVAKFFDIPALAQRISSLFTIDDDGKLTNLDMTAFNDFIEQPYKILQRIEKHIADLDKKITILLQHPIELDPSTSALQLYKDFNFFTHYRSYIKEQHTDDLTNIEFGTITPAITASLLRTINEFLVCELYTYQYLMSAFKDHLAQLEMVIPELPQAITTLLRINPVHYTAMVKDIDLTNTQDDAEQFKMIAAHIDALALGQYADSLCVLMGKDSAKKCKSITQQVTKTLSAVRFAIYCLHYIATQLSQNQNSFKDTELWKLSLRVKQILGNIEEIAISPLASKQTLKKDKPSFVTRGGRRINFRGSRETDEKKPAEKGESVIPVVVAEIITAETNSSAASSPAEEKVDSNANTEALDDNLKKQTELLGRKNEFLSKREALLAKKNEFDKAYKDLTTSLSSFNNRRKRSSLSSSASEISKKFHATLKKLCAKMEIYSLDTSKDMQAVVKAVDYFLTNTTTACINQIFELRTSISSLPPAQTRASSVSLTDMQRGTSEGSNFSLSPHSESYPWEDGATSSSTSNHSSPDLIALELETAKTEIEAIQVLEAEIKLNDQENESAHSVAISSTDTDDRKPHLTIDIEDEQIIITTEDSKAEQIGSPEIIVKDAEALIREFYQGEIKPDQTDQASPLATAETIPTDEKETTNVVVTSQAITAALEEDNADETVIAEPISDLTETTKTITATSPTSEQALEEDSKGEAITAEPIPALTEPMKRITASPTPEEALEEGKAIHNISQSPTYYPTSSPSPFDPVEELIRILQLEKLFAPIPKFEKQFLFARNSRGWNDPEKTYDSNLTKTAKIIRPPLSSTTLPVFNYPELSFFSTPVPTKKTRQSSSVKSDLDPTAQVFTPRFNF